MTNALEPTPEHADACRVALDAYREAVEARRERENLNAKVSQEFDDMVRPIYYPPKVIELPAAEVPPAPWVAWSMVAFTAAVIGIWVYIAATGGFR